MKRKDTKTFIHRGKQYRFYEGCPSKQSADLTAEHLPKVGLKPLVVELLKGWGVFVTKGEVSTEELMKEVHRLHKGKHPRRIVKG